MADDLYVFHIEGWVKRGTSLINPTTLTASGTETVTAAADTTTRQMGSGTPVGEKALLTWSDLTFLGTYALPTHVAGKSYPSGLTHRWVSGESYPRFYCCSLIDGQVVEARPTSEPGALVGLTQLGILGSPVIQDPVYGDARLWGLHWHAGTQRLYWGQQRRYNGTMLPSLGYATLVTGMPSVMTPRAVFSLHAAGQDTLWHYGMTTIPDWWSTAYGGGRTLAVGFGRGADSPLHSRRHNGLGLYAMRHPDLALDTVPYEGGYIYTGGLQVLSSHFYNTTDARGTKAVVSGDWFQLMAANALDHSRDDMCGAAWVDTPTKHGLVITQRAGESVWAAGRTTVTVAAPAGATSLTLADDTTGLQADDLLFVQTSLKRTAGWQGGGLPETGGNGSFGSETWTPPPGETYTAGAPYGECVRITSVAGKVITFRVADPRGSNLAQAGLYAPCSAGAVVLMGQTYWDAVVPQSRGVPLLYVFDPMHFAEVAQGTRAQDAVNYSWAQDQPFFPSQPARVMKGGVWEEAMGHAADLTYDAVQGRLYALREGGAFTAGWSDNAIHVWQVT